MSTPPPVALETGEIDVSADVEGYVVYGGYYRLPDGLYLVDVQFGSQDSDDSAVPAVVDVFDNGLVLAEALATRQTRLLVSLSDTKAVEVRIRACGGAFRCSSIRLRCLYDAERRAVAASLDAIASDLAKEGRADLSVLISDYLASVDSPHEAVGFTEAGSVAGMLPASQMRVVWRALHSAQPLEQWSMLLHQNPAARGGPVKAFVKAEPEVEFIDYSSNSAAAAAALREQGLDAAAIRMLSVDRWSLEEELVARALGDEALGRLRHARAGLPEHPTFKSSLMRELSTHEHAFQTTALVLGCVVVPSPLTGQPLVSRHAIIVPVEHGKQVFLFYFFGGAEPFYLAVGGWPGQKVLVYFPLKNLIVGLAHPSQSWTPYPVLIDTLKYFVLVGADQISAYLAAKTRPAILTATINNMGHSFWNDQSRLVQLERVGLLSKATAMVIYREVFVDPMDLVEFTGEVFRATNADALFETIYRQRLFCVRPTALALMEEDVRKIELVARTRTANSTWSQIAEARKAHLVLWVNLRAHNKVWVDQVEGIVKIAADLAAEHGSLALFLDGMRDCEPLAREIRDRAPPRVMLFDGVNLPVADSISWAFAVDAYIATIGSGLTMVTWLANKPGVAHADREHLGQLEFWRDVRQGLAPIQAPRLSDVEETVGGWYSDYRVPLDKMLRLTRKAVNSVRKDG